LILKTQCQDLISLKSPDLLLEISLLKVLHQEKPLKDPHPRDSPLAVSLPEILLEILEALSQARCRSQQWISKLNLLNPVNPLKIQISILN